MEKLCPDCRKHVPKGEDCPSCGQKGRPVGNRFGLDVHERRKFETPEELMDAIDGYWDAKEPARKSFSGMLLGLGFRSMRGWYYYREKYGPDMAEAVAYGYLRNWRYYEELGQDPRQGSHPDRMLTRLGWPAVEESKQEHDATDKFMALMEQVNGTRHYPSTDE